MKTPFPFFKEKRYNMRFTQRDKENIYHLLRGRPHLSPVFSSALNIPERVKAYDADLFIVFNMNNERFEVHSYDAGETSYNATLPFKSLDARTIRYIRKNDIRVHGMKIYDRINQSEERHKKSKEKKEKDFVRDFAAEFQSEFAKDAWSM